MAEFTNLTYNRAKHRAEEGNLIADALQVTITSAMASGDVILVDTGPWDSLYLSCKVARADLTDGMTVKVGVREIMGSFVDDDYFGSQLVSAAGVSELITLPREVVDASGRKISHEIIVTPTGTLTAGESFWVIFERLCFGAPL